MGIYAEPGYDPTRIEVTGRFNDLLDVFIDTPFEGATVVYNNAYTGWIIGTGSTATGSLNSLADVDTAGATSGQALGYFGSVVGWAPLTVTGTQGPTGLQGSTGLQGPAGTGGFASGVNYLDELADVNLGGALNSNQVLLHNGSYWTQSYFATTNLSNTTGHALVDNDHALVFQPSINKYVSTHVLAAPTGLRSIDSDAQASGNTDIIQARINGDSGIVYIPTGTYKVNTLYVRGNHVHICGPGRLLAVTGYTGDAVIVVSGNGCLIEDIAIDGNGKAYSGAIGRGEGLAIVGSDNIIRNVHVFNTPSGTLSNSIVVRSSGSNNIIEECYVSGAGYAAYYCNGDYNTFRNNKATHFRNRGFACTGGPYNKLTIDGFYSDNPVSFYQLNNGGAALEINPGTGTDQYIRHVDINRAIIGNGGSGGSCAQFGKLTNLNITNSIFYPRHSLGDTPGMYSSNLTTNVKILNGIDNLTIDNSWIASHITFSNSIVRNLSISKTRFGEYTNNGSGNFGSGYTPASHIEDMMSSGTITIHDCKFYGFSAHAIDLASPPRDIYPASGYEMLDIQRCHFAGSGAGTLRDINMTSPGAVNWSRRVRYFDNTREALGGGNALITTSAWYPYFTPLNLNASEYSGAAPPTSSSTNWRVGDIIRNTTPTTGGNMGWVCVQSGAPGSWLEFGDPGKIISQSYFSGVYDVVLSGISNTAQLTGIATQIQALVDNLPEDSTLRFPPGKYWLNKTIHFNHKRGLNIIAHGARFYETPDRLWLNSGAFYFHKCTGVYWHGGFLSGVADMQYNLSVASGLEYSGGSFNDLALDTQLTRNVIPNVFNFEQSNNFAVDDFHAKKKYRFMVTHRCMNYSFTNCTFSGVHNIYLDRLAQNLVQITSVSPGTGFAQKGDIDKESARTSFAWSITKGEHLRMNNCHARDCGGFINAGSASLGGGQGPDNPEMSVITNCSAQNSHDNHIYFSSCNKLKVIGFVGRNDVELPHSIGGVKGRGAYITFDGCYVEHAHHAYGFEGLGGNPTKSDYWTTGGDPGWSSQGCMLVNSHAVDIGSIGVFADPADEEANTFARDVIIKNNYFYNCYLGPSGRYPTGYSNLTNEAGNAVITVPDCYRVQVVGNTVENSGAAGPDQAVYVGQYRWGGGSSADYFRGCEISDNRFLGVRMGIYARNIDYARIKNNYGERIGINNYWHITYSGEPCLIFADNITNSIIKDNILCPTGSAKLLRMNPGSIMNNNIIQDNIGTIEIN